MPKSFSVSNLNAVHQRL